MQHALSAVVMQTWRHADVWQLQCRTTLWNSKSNFTQILLIYNIHFSDLIMSQICTKHSSMSAMGHIKFQDTWTCKNLVRGKQNFMSLWFHKFKMCLGGCPILQKLSNPLPRRVIRWNWMNKFFGRKHRQRPGDFIGTEKHEYRGSHKYRV